MKISKLLKRWIDMLFGKSVFHVKQGIGRRYSKEVISGYYNDLTGKVSELTTLDENGIPITKTIANVVTYFPISIFQYGLGLYDLYLDNNDEQILKQFLDISNWAYANQLKNGMWNCMGCLNDRIHESQSAMCQSEGTSVLLRAYVETHDKKYLIAAKKSIDFMVLPINKNGTCLYSDNDIVFQEYVSSDNLSVLNGWIFSIFGLIDFTKISDDLKYTKLLEQTVDSLARNLYKYDRGFWSNYDMKGTIASPAYHDIHIMQLRLLYDLFGKEEFNDYANKWQKYQQSKFKKILAMTIKFKQKVFKNKYYDINTTTVS